MNKATNSDTNYKVIDFIETKWFYAMLPQTAAQSTLWKLGIVTICAELCGPALGQTNANTRVYLVLILVLVTVLVLVYCIIVLYSTV